jgi:hypothetical protein
MTNGFQHQDPMTNYCVPKSEPKPQHGRKPDADALKLKERRGFEPRPGH